jgi:hypothetical protein
MYVDIHNESATAHSAIPVKKVLAKLSRLIPQLKQRLHSPDVAPCDDYLFSKPNLTSNEKYFITSK